MFCLLLQERELDLQDTEGDGTSEVKAEEKQQFIKYNKYMEALVQVSKGNSELMVTQLLVSFVLPLLLFIQFYTNYSSRTEKGK